MRAAAPQVLPRGRPGIGSNLSSHSGGVQERPTEAMSRGRPASQNRTSFETFRHEPRPPSHSRGGHREMQGFNVESYDQAYSMNDESAVRGCSPLRTVAGAAEAGFDEERLLGVWVYRDDSRYTVSRGDRGRLRFNEKHSTGRIVSGFLRWQGPWLIGELDFNDGEPLGQIRLRPVEEYVATHASKLLLVSDFKDASTGDWVPHTVASKEQPLRGGPVKNPDNLPYDNAVFEGKLLQETVLAQELEIASENLTKRQQELESNTEVSTSMKLARRLKQEASHLEKQLNIELEERNRNLNRFDALRTSLRSEEAEHEWFVKEASCEHLQYLEYNEALTGERARSSRNSELRAMENAQEFRQRVLELRGDCDALVLSAAADKDRFDLETEHIKSILLDSFPKDHPMRQAPSLDHLLEAMVFELPNIKAASSRWSADRGTENDPAMRQLQQEVEDLVQRLSQAEVEARQESKRHDEVAKESRTCREDLSEFNDFMAEVALLRKESDYMRRQQAEWERTQFRMLHLADDLQKQRIKATQSQALLATRVGDLQRELPLEDLWARRSGESAVPRGHNAALREDIARLERENAKLVSQSQGLSLYLRSSGSKAPPSTAVAEPAERAPISTHVASRAECAATEQTFPVGNRANLVSVSTQPAAPHAAAEQNSIPGVSRAISIPNQPPASHAATITRVPPNSQPILTKNVEIPGAALFRQTPGGYPLAYPPSPSNSVVGDFGYPVSP